MKSGKKRILLVGDFALNQFFHGTAIRVAKDAPIPVINISKTILAPGYAGIIAETISRFGGRVIPVGIVGNDFAGMWLKKKLSDSKIHSDNLLSMSKIKTPITSKLISNLIQVAHFDQVNDYKYSQQIEKNLLAKIEKEITNAGLVVIADYGLGTISHTVSRKIIKMTEEEGTGLFVSSTRDEYLKYKNSNSMIKINTPDSLSLIKESTNYKLSSYKILEKLHNVLGIDKILLTREEQGIVVYENDMITERPATKDQRVNINGIGEVMIATICTSLIHGNGFLDACELGNIGAGLAVSKGNIEVITKKDIQLAKKEYYEWVEQK